MNRPESSSSRRIESVHSLRGIASLAVALFHLSDGPHLPTLLHSICSYGKFGVEVFFVISGFVLPYSLWRAGYVGTFRNYRSFLWKRVVRLDPPYLATIAFILVLDWLSSKSAAYQGSPFSIDILRLLSHLGYLVGLLGMNWLNPVFWTLAIECQFYLLIAALHSLLVHSSVFVRSGAILLLLGLSFIGPPQKYVLNYLPFFVLGIVIFQCHVHLSSKLEVAFATALAAIVIYSRMGLDVAIIGCLGAGLILLLPDWKDSTLSFLGNISYSLYLLHVPLGGRVINLSRRLQLSSLESILVLCLAVGLSVAFAYLLWRFVERPSQRYAASIRFSG